MYNPLFDRMFLWAQRIIIVELAGWMRLYYCIGVPRRLMEMNSLFTINHGGF